MFGGMFLFGLARNRVVGMGKWNARTNKGLSENIATNFRNEWSVASLARVSDKSVSKPSRNGVAYTTSDHTRVILHLD